MICGAGSPSPGDRMARTTRDGSHLRGPLARIPIRRGGPDDGSMLRRAASRIVLVCVALGMFLAVAQGVAQAHAILVSTVPVPGARLGTAPGVVVLGFS